MQFDSKFNQFLKILVKQKEISGITALANRSGLSRRMIYYYIEKLNELLLTLDSPILEKQARGVLQLSSQQQRKIKEWLKNQKKQDFILTINERRVIVTVLILIENQKWQLNHFQELFLVSRNTILKDIQWVKEHFAVSEIQLKSTKAKGYHIIVDELERRQLIYQQLYLIETGQKEACFDFLLGALGYENLEILKETIIEPIKKLIEKTKGSLGKELAAQDIHILSKLIFILKDRNTKNCIPKWTDGEEFLIKERLEYQVAKKLLVKIELIVKINYLEEEALYYGMLLLCIEKNTDAHFKSNPFENLIYLTENLVTLFEQIVGLYFHDRENLIKKIQTHLKVLYYRHVFDMQMPSYGLDNVSTYYQKAFRLTEKVSNLMKSDVVFQHSFPDGFSKEELAEVALYFEEAILKEQTKQYVPQLIIVSDFPDVLNSLLENHLRQLLPNVSIVGILKSDNAHFYSGKVDYCISTNTNYVHNQGETVIVSVILTKEEKMRIKKIEQSHGRYLKMRDKIKQLMNDYQYLTNQEDFISELSHVLEQSEKNSVETQHIELIDFLKNPFFCCIKQEVGSLTEMMSLLSGPLIEEKYIQPTYTQQVLKELKEERFIFLYPKVLLVHTDYRFGSMKPGCSFLYLKTPFVLSTNEQVQFVLFLATEENMGHVPLLFELDHLLQGSFLRELKEKNSFKEAITSIDW